ncbi:hypothetical protein B0T24DRAFT_644947 [Lasiosphaeria ovina]|uniref:Uncharacterized protein n=1 Tax=Lasiosphaeria ovina TaxID=92902 RepID=A0AAE0NID7_9PEZI|nr:hypothetical protein B0T24DRAFT_644947 [Lasiosphaeria ovina]
MSSKPADVQWPYHRLPWSTVILYGAGAGFLGVAVMTASEKVEQLFTGRANSEVPGKMLARLLGTKPRSAEQLWRLNMAMHYGLRLLVDQTLENWTGIGALPWTWPVGEQIINLAHKAVYAMATGYFTEL